MKIDKILEDAGWVRDPEFKHYSSITKDITCKWIKGDKQVLTGLNEKGKPPTLISPRPIIRITRIGTTYELQEDGRLVESEPKPIVYDEDYDDSMNYVIDVVHPDKILEAMFDKRIKFEYDLT